MSSGAIHQRPYTSTSPTHLSEMDEPQFRIGRTCNPKQTTQSSDQDVTPFRIRGSTEPARRYVLILEQLFLVRRLEPFVLGEILRQSKWSPEPCNLYHFRDKDQNEVDIVAEDLLGQIVGIEVKASATVRGVGAWLRVKDRSPSRGTAAKCLTPLNSVPTIRLARPWRRSTCIQRCG